MTNHHQPAYFVNPPSGTLLVKRDGHSITRSIPKPIVLADTREQTPFTFERMGNWIGWVETKKLATGDYSVEGMEKLLALERKRLTDLITTLMQDRTRFFRSCEKLAKLHCRAIHVEASYEDIKSPYEDEYTYAHPNAVCGSLDAVEAKFGIPVIYTSKHRHLAAEKAAGWLSKHFTYWHLEKEGLGRVLQDHDI